MDGSFLSSALHGLANNTALTLLDVSNNAMRDPGGTTLGQALRKNRTLTALRWDGNGTGLAGFQEFRGCLYGNQKLVDVPPPQADLQAFSAASGLEMATHVQKEHEARSYVRYYCKRATANYYKKQECVSRRRLVQCRGLWGMRRGSATRCGGARARAVRSRAGTMGRSVQVTGCGTCSLGGGGGGRTPFSVAL